MSEPIRWGELRPRIEGDFAAKDITFAGFWERSDLPITRVEPATTCAVLIFPIDGEMDINGIPIDSPVMIRPSAAPTRTGHAGSQCCVEVRIPLLLSARLHEVSAGNPDPIFLNSGSRPPRSTAWQDHFDFASDTVRNMLASARPETDNLIEAAWAALRVQGYRPVEELASQLGVSARHLRRIFRIATGFSPSGATQLARFERAWALLQENGNRSLAEIAAAAGYSDQAHMTRAFSQLAGIAPSRALALLAGPFPGLVVT